MTVTDELNAWIAEHGSCRDALNVALARLRHLRATLTDLECENADLWNEKFERDEVRVIDLNSNQMALLWKRAAKHWRKRWRSETDQLLRWAAKISEARDEARRERDEALAQLNAIRRELPLSISGNKVTTSIEVFAPTEELMRIALERIGSPSQPEVLARLRLAEEALRDVEWVYDPYGEGDRECPWCLNVKSEGHSPDCLRQKALTPPEPSSS